MTTPVKHRPLPALIGLVALLVLTGLVWWRVLDRSTPAKHPKSCPTTSAPVAAPTVRLPARSAVDVTVLNATTRAGIATKARQALVAAGFSSKKAAGNAPAKLTNKIKSVAEIEFGPTGRQGAILLRYYFPGATLVSIKTTSPTVQVLLGTKYRSVATARSVAAALKRADTVVGTPTPSPTSSTASC